MCTYAVEPVYSGHLGDRWGQKTVAVVERL